MWLSTRSWIKVRRSFSKIHGYHAKNLPAISTLQRVLHKCEDHGTVGDCRKGSVLAITATEVRKVERLYKKISVLLCALRQEGWTFRNKKDS